MTKLNKTRIKWLVRQVVKHGKAPSEVAPVYGLTARRVRQLVQHFKETGKMPELKSWRRPKTFLSDEQKEEIDKAFDDTKLSPRLLYFELKAKGAKVPKNKLYAYLKQKNLVISNPRKQKKRKRCRYERKHSGSLLHGDSHRTSLKHPYCILWMDDASRKILGGGESDSPTNNAMAIRTVKQAVKSAKEYNVTIKQVNTDRGPEFFSNKKKYKDKSYSDFEKFLAKSGIDHVLSRVNNPQTNGKIERHWREYDKHRRRFKTLKRYIDWYNNRLHGALNLDWAEKPHEAFIRKLPQESLIGLMFNEKRKK